MDQSTSKAIYRAKHKANLVELYQGMSRKFSVYTMLLLEFLDVWNVQTRGTGEKEPEPGRDLRISSQGPGFSCLARSRRLPCDLTKKLSNCTKTKRIIESICFSLLILKLRNVTYSGHIVYFLPLFGILKGARQPVGPLNAQRHSFNEPKEAPFAVCFLELTFGAAVLKEPIRWRTFTTNEIRRAGIVYIYFTAGCFSHYSNQQNSM